MTNAAIFESDPDTSRRVGRESSYQRNPIGIDLFLHAEIADSKQHAVWERTAAHPDVVVGIFGDRDGIRITLGGGAAGFMRSPDRSRLSVAADALDDASLAIEAASFGALFIAPHVGETLRVNGRVEAHRDGIVMLHVEECYVHCAKAIIRSDFWQAGVPKAD